jgi:allantoin racemase
MTPILMVDSNITASATVRIDAAARETISPGTEIVLVNPADGPASTEGPVGDAASRMVVPPG